MITLEEARNREMLVQTLMSLQTGCTERDARLVLQKHGWNADQAAVTLLDVAAAEEAMKTGTGSQRQGIIDVDEWMSTGVLNSSNNPLPMQPRPNSVIDLTGDDDEDTAKAIEASMESQTMFGPINRIDVTQHWAMVPSNTPLDLSQEDQALNRALEASLTSSFAGVAHEPYSEPSDPMDRVRKDGWPTALRSTNSATCYAPIVLQCLLSLPQVYRRLLHYDVHCAGAEDYHVLAQGLQGLAAMLDHTTRAYVAIDDILDTLFPPAPISNQDPLPALTHQYYMAFANALEYIPHRPGSGVPLMTFHGVATDAGVNESSIGYASGSIIDLLVPSPSGNDLVSCMTDTFSRSDVCLTQLSECVTFVIRRQEGVGLSAMEKTPFKYPTRVYLDRFMQENLEHGNELRDFHEGIHHEIQRLITDRLKLSSWKNEDTLKDLRSATEYFEKLASDGGDPIRKEAQERSKVKLLKTIEQIEMIVQNIDARIKALTAEAEGLFERPDLQEHGYDLRAVIIHDGLFGRNHVYSYTNDEKGKWWKIVDYQVSEVSEDVVLNDSTGLHLGAGPLLLFYSQSSPSHGLLGGYEEPQWPPFAMDLVREENTTFLAQLPPKVASLVLSRSDVLHSGMLSELNETSSQTAKPSPESPDGNGPS